MISVGWALISTTGILKIIGNLNTDTHKGNMRRHKKTANYKPRNEDLEETNPDNILILDF